MRPYIVDMKPQYQQNGSVLYGEIPLQQTKEDVTVSLNDGSIVTVVDGKVKVKLPNGQVVTSTNEGLGDGKQVGNIMMNAGGVVAVIVPIGTIVGAIISGAGALISAFSNGKAAQAANAAAGKIELVNAQLRSENEQLDAKIIDLQKAIVKAKQDLGLSGLNGLGWCLINCAKNQAQERLKTSQQIYEELLKDQDLRIQTLQKLTDETTRLFTKKKTLTYVYIGTGILVFGALVYLISKSN